MNTTRYSEAAGRFMAGPFMAGRFTAARTNGGCMGFMAGPHLLH